MKKTLFLMVALMATITAHAQVSVNMENLFTLETGDDGKAIPIELNEPVTIKDGVAFIGDTRTPDKITDGKYKGMRISKSGRYYATPGKPAKYGVALNFRRAPQGVMKDKKMDLTQVPRSCMLQLKPTSGGQLTFNALTTKDENNLYVAVVNGTSYQVIATIAYAKGDENYGRKKESPAEVKTCDYTYKAGDEIWIFSDGGINLHNFTFSGTIDTAFLGSNPVSVAKAIKKANK